MTTYLDSEAGPPARRATDPSLTNGSAADLFSVEPDSGERLSGSLEFAVRADDGTDGQVAKGKFDWAVANKAGTVTTQLSPPSPVLAETDDAQTLDVDFSWSVVGTVATLQVEATSSLTPTSLSITYEDRRF